MRSPKFSILVLTILLATWGCSRQLPLAPEGNGRVSVSAAAGDLKSSPATDNVARHVEGSLGPGALYGMDVPADWNGDLVLYMHGIKPPTAPVALPWNFEDFDAILAGLLADGNAVAYSSYSENGYAIAEGARQSHQLAHLFGSKFGQPKRVFLFGQSLGGIVGLYLAEKYPSEYAGAFFVAGVLGGSKAEVDYLAHTRVLFDYFYQNPLGGDLFHVPDVPYNPSQVLAALQSDGFQGLGAMARLKQVQLPYTSAPELVQSVITAIGVQWIGGEDFFDRTHGHNLFDNHDVVYDALAPGLLPPALLADLNQRVVRYQTTPDAAAWLEHHYEPTGDLRIPMLTMHTSLDPVVPFFHEGLYFQKVSAAGHADMLLQRTKNIYGHRKFTPAELLNGFRDLVGWVNSGVRPAV